MTYINKKDLSSFLFSCIMDIKVKEKKGVLSFSARPIIGQRG